MTSYNCDCTADYPRETLLTLRTRLLRRLGFSAQAANPPPGMAALLDDFLIEAQQIIDSTPGIGRGKRWFTWPLVVGERFYDYGDGNDETAPCAAKLLDPGMIEWVGVSDGDANWTPLTRGISPQAYSGWATLQGFPSRYDIRECIELWPAPSSAAHKLRVFGRFGLLPFAVDGDYTTLDSTLIFLLALANAKAHYKQQDAALYMERYTDRVFQLVAQSHQGNRYVPYDMQGWRWEGLNGVSGPAGIRFLTTGEARTIV